MSQLKIYNSLTRRKEEFVPIEAGRVRLYACGPTVYNYAHIGNMRTYVFEDILHRVLKRVEYEVHHVMNITDVGHLQSDADTGDDKMSVAAQREQKSPWDIAKFYESEFFRHAALLNIRKPNTICRATGHIAEMIAMVQILIEKGYAYISGHEGANDANVYFDVSRFGAYADFANLRLDEQASTDRVDHDDRKRNQADFVLWFSQSKFPNQIMKWDSPWGIGFPGWHIECSAMASKYLGDHIDIHCGGIDHITVHHTNEIAQSEGCFGHKWVNYWMHGAFLQLDNQKMSKSQGGVLTVDTLVREGFDPLDYRYLLLTAHYRGELKFSYETLSAARVAYQNWKERILDWKNALQEMSNPDLVKKYKERFTAAICDDLHMPEAVAVAWEVAKSTTLTSADKLVLFEDFDEIFGLNLLASTKAALNDEQMALIAAREQARTNKDWKESDRLRDLLKEQGIQIKDTANGTDWTKI
jgi:cysteinyl-tRNA synthetase